jgi:aminopeptidase YwaD
LGLNEPGIGFVLKLIEEMSLVPRSAGSKPCATQCESLRSQIESTGNFTVEEQSFEFEEYIPSHWELGVGDEAEECIPAICSVSTPRSGLTGPICSAETGDVEDKIVLLRISSVHESAVVEDLAVRGALAVLAFQESGPMLSGRVRYPASTIPCMMISSELGAQLWRTSATGELHARMTLRATTSSGRGTNLFAEPKRANAAGLYVAHHDSRQFSPGAIDNASGSALLVFLARSTNNPLFSLLSTDAEEYGLLGSKHFVKTRDDLDRGISVLNLDSIGSGSLHLVDRSRVGPLSAALNSRITSIARGIGLQLQGLSIPRGSDCDVFVERGFEGAWLRSHPTPTATTMQDTVEHIEKGIMESVCTLLKSISSSQLH